MIELIVSKFVLYETCVINAHIQNKKNHALISSQSIPHSCQTTMSIDIGWTRKKK